MRIIRAKSNSPLLTQISDVPHTPILVVGSDKTCGARLVRQFRFGEVVPYDSALVSAAMDRLIEPKTQLEMRQRAARKAVSFSDLGVAEWLADSTALGRPVDNRYEDGFADYDATIDLLPFVSGARAVAAKLSGD